MGVLVERARGVTSLVTLRSNCTFSSISPPRAYVFLQCGIYLDSLCYGLHDLVTVLVGQQLLLGRHNLDLLGGLGQRGLVVRSRGVVVVGFGSAVSDDARHRLSR